RFLRSAVHDRTVNGFGRNDGSWGWFGKTKRGMRRAMQGFILITQESCGHGSLRQGHRSGLLSTVSTDHSTLLRAGYEAVPQAIQALSALFISAPSIIAV